jgi:hypothetical protein
MYVLNLIVAIIALLKYTRNSGVKFAQLEMSASSGAASVFI